MTQRGHDIISDAYTLGKSQEKLPRVKGMPAATRKVFSKLAFHGGWSLSTTMNPQFCGSSSPEKSSCTGHSETTLCLLVSRVKKV